MNRRKAALAAGMAAILVLSGSGALAASPQPGPTGPCVKSATCSPADLAKLKERAAKDGAIKSDDPGRDAVKCAGEPMGTKKRIDGKEPHPIDSAELARALADTLGVSLDRATAAAEELFRLGEQGGIRPDSAEFAAVAERLGVSADRLNEALKAFKRAHAPKDAKPGPGSTPGS